MSGKQPPAEIRNGPAGEALDLVHLLCDAVLPLHSLCCMRLAPGLSRQASRHVHGTLGCA